jgi:hypothetical protein
MNFIVIHRYTGIKLQQTSPLEWRADSEGPVSYKVNRDTDSGMMI